MKKFSALMRNFKVGVKACQNLRYASIIFNKLSDGDIADTTILRSLFCTGIISYAKPFVTTKMNERDARYPISRLKTSSGFSEEIHKQVMLLRNTLVAHDDFDQIGPQLLFLSINPDGTAFQIPVSIIASHKSILYPSESEKIKQIRDHVTAAATAVIKNLRDDGARLRALIIENPERLYNAPYNRHYGSAYIPPEGAHLTPPDISQDDWLKPRGPAYLITKDGFEYESVRVKFDFFGPEVIKLPNGDEIHITPEKVKKL